MWFGVSVRVYFSVRKIPPGHEGSRISRLQQVSAHILVIGATGRIGAVLRRYWPDGRAIWQSRSARAGFVCFDPLTDPAAFADAARPATAILCLAGVVNGREAEAGFEPNETLALASVRAAAATGIPVFLASSAAVYGNQPGCLDESAPLNPQSEYARAKVRMETRAAALGAEVNVPVCALRIGNIAGLDAILGGWRPGFALDRFADGHTPRRSYVGVRTLADMLWDVVSGDNCPPALNIACPGAIGMGALLDAAGLDWAPRPPGDTAIPKVELDVSALSACTDRAARHADPLQMIREWRDYTAAGPSA